MVWMIGLLIATADARAYLRNPGECDRLYQISEAKVFFNQMEVANADAKTFVELHWLTKDSACAPGAFGKDKANVFFQGNAIPSAKPKDFGIWSEYYSFSGAQVFFRNLPIPGVDQKSFRLDGQNKMWATDKNRFYCGANPLEFATLSVLNEHYVKDAKQVCFNDVIVEGADSASFAAGKYDEATDKKQKYRAGRPAD